MRPLPGAATLGLDAGGLILSHGNDVRAASVCQTNLDLRELQQMLQNGNSLVSSFYPPIGRQVR